MFLFCLYFCSLREYLSGYAYSRIFTRLLAMKNGYVILHDVIINFDNLNLYACMNLRDQSQLNLTNDIIQMIVYPRVWKNLPLLWVFAANTLSFFRVNVHMEKKSAISKRKRRFKPNHRAAITVFVACGAFMFCTLPSTLIGNS